jgi:hypothetical protein
MYAPDSLSVLVALHSSINTAVALRTDAIQSVIVTLKALEQSVISTIFP